MKAESRLNAVEIKFHIDKTEQVNETKLGTPRQESANQIIDLDYVKSSCGDV